MCMQTLGYLEVVLRLQRFVIEDRLVGSRSQDLAFLARSFSDYDQDRQNSVNIECSSLGAPSPGINLSLAHLRSPHTPPTRRGSRLRRVSHGASQTTPLSSSARSHSKQSPAVTPRTSAEVGGHTVAEHIDEEDDDDENDNDYGIPSRTKRERKFHRQKPKRGMKRPNQDGDDTIDADKDTNDNFRIPSLPKRTARAAREPNDFQGN